MTPVDISIIIVNYNVKDFLLQCLRSIESAKKNFNIEVFVVDNNSTDGSVEYLEPLFPQFKFIKLDENYGFPIANNTAIKQAKGKYELILNPDTILSEETLEVMYDYMENNPQVGMSGCKLLNADGTFQLACRRGFPTPWASFTKLFGLQTIFPNSKLFARYNQTFRNINETYYIDVLMGAFMFGRKEIIDKIGGFDEDFFMYGEDIEICWQTKQLGYEVAYVPDTSVIHFKGESTRRSPINELKYFYGSMEIFARKHFAKSYLFLSLIRLAIVVRAFLAYLNKHKIEIIVILFDILAINASMLFGTYQRWGDFFHFPGYAYPTVFFAVTIVLLFSMISVGEYFEGKPSLRKSFFGLLISFFILSSLTYFFREYAFSRGVVLMTIGFTMILSSFIRIAISTIEKFKGKKADKRIAIVGTNKQANNIINSLQSAEVRNAVITGIVTVSNTGSVTDINLPVLGNIEYLSQIIEHYKLHEVIITDESISKNDLMQIISKTSNSSVLIHAAQEYDAVLTSRIIDEISGVEPTIPKLNIAKFRFRIVKRFIDILFSFLALTLGIPCIYLFANEKSKLLKQFWLTFIGKKSLVGLYSNDNLKLSIGKPGIIGLAHISRPNLLTERAINELNNYYLQNYSLALDLDIFVKFIFRKQSGN